MRRAGPAPASASGGPASARPATTPYAHGMAADTFADVLGRIETIALRVGQLDVDAPATLTRDELIDVLDALHRVGKAMVLLQERGRFR